MKRFDGREIDGATRATALSQSKVEATPIASRETAPSASNNPHDPIGWLLKRLGVLFLVAVTIALVLLIALPHGHASTPPPHRTNLVPKALLPGKL
jgi:hypothetical protein